MNCTSDASGRTNQEMFEWFSAWGYVVGSFGRYRRTGVVVRYEFLSHCSRKPLFIRSYGELAETSKLEKEISALPTAAL